MQRITSEGTRLWIQAGDLAVGEAIASITKDAPAVITLAAPSIMFFAGAIVRPQDTGWRSLNGRAFQVILVDGTDITLGDSDTSDEEDDALAGTLVPIDMIEFCTVSVEIVSPAGTELDTTTICDDARTVKPGLPAISTWQAGGFWDITDTAMRRAQALLRSREVVVFAAQFNDDSGLVFSASVNSFEVRAGVDQAVTINAGGSISGQSTMLDVNVEGLAFHESTLYLAEWVGYRNVFVRGRDQPISFSQQGDFHAARWQAPNMVTVEGPNTDWPVGTLRIRTWDVHDKILVYGFILQSNSAGVNESFTMDSPIDRFSNENPLAHLQCFVGGIANNQNGVRSPALNTLINSAQYLTLVPAHENINTGRTPGDEVTEEMWSMSFGEVVAAAVPDDNIVLPINVSIGATEFSDTVQKAIGITTASRVGTTTTYVFASDTFAAVGDTFTVQNAAPAGYNGLKTVVTVSVDRKTITVTQTDPGAFTTVGTGLFWAAPMVNLRTMLRYLVNTVGPALGKAVEFRALCLNGNESEAATILATTTWKTAELDVVRQMVNELGVICGQADAGWIIWPQVDYPVSIWTAGSDKLNAASAISLGALVYSRDPTLKLITRPQYPAVAGGEGDNTPEGSLHYGVQGHSDNGESPANLYLDAETGDAVHEPLQIVAGSLSRIANSTTITATMNRAAVVDRKKHISDPGNYGYQAFAGALGGGNGFEVTIASVDLDGTDLTVELEDLPLSYSNKLSYAYKNAFEFETAYSFTITNMTWAAGVATYTTLTPHNLEPGDTVAITHSDPGGYDVVPAALALAGTTGSTIKMTVASDPGTAPITNAVWSGLGRTTFTTSVVSSRTIGAYVTVSGMNPAGYDGTWEIINIVSTTSFIVDMPTDPGAFISGGAFVGSAFAVQNGQFGLGRNQGLRGIVRDATIDHFSNRSGAPLIRAAAMQYEDIAVEPSSNSILAMLIELGLDGDFDGVYDFADADCYSGSGTSIVNLLATADTGFTLGDAGNRLPVYAGTPDSFDGTTGFHSTLNAEINSTSGTSNPLWTNAHKIGQGHTAIYCGFLPSAALTRNNYLFTTTQGEGGGPAEGIYTRIASTRTPNHQVRNATTAAYTATGLGAAFTANSNFLFGVGIRDGDFTSWTYRGETHLFTQISPVFSSPSAGARQSAPSMMMNGTTGTVYMEANVGMKAVLIANKKISQERIDPLMRGLRRRFILGLPPP
jgi:hypothetical protein